MCVSVSAWKGKGLPLIADTTAAGSHGRGSRRPQWWLSSPFPDIFFCLWPMSSVITFRTIWSFSPSLLKPLSFRPSATQIIFCSFCFLSPSIQRFKCIVVPLPDMPLVDHRSYSRSQTEFSPILILFSTTLFVFSPTLVLLSPTSVPFLLASSRYRVSSS